MSRRKLLLADDSVTIQKVVNLTFADEGIDVVTVGDGDSAMERIAEARPDVVLADVNMPGLTGYQICERLRGDEATKNTPVVLLVGSFEPFDEAEAARVGANAYLTKPFQSIRQLVSQVSDLMEATARSENGEALAAEPAADAPAELEDIDNLYHQSLSGTENVLGEEKTSASDYGDFGLDDEIIETSYVHGGGESEFVDFEVRQEDFSDIAEPEEQRPPEQSFATEEPEQAAEAQVEEAFAAIEQHPEPASEADLGGFDPERFVFPPETPASDQERSRDHQMAAAFDQEEREPTLDRQPEEVEAETDFAPAQGNEPTPEFSARIDHYADHAESAPVAETATEEFQRTEESDYSPHESLTQPETEPLSTESEPSPFAKTAEESTPIGHETAQMERRFDTFSSDTAKFDEIDLLELPSIASGKTYELTTPAAAKEAESTTQIVSLSPELIEMIAQRVVEKLSEKY